MAELSDPHPPTWWHLEAGSGVPDDADAGHWVSVYTNLLTLLGKGAAVSVGDRTGNEHVRLALDEVRERLGFWQQRLDAHAS